MKLKVAGRFISLFLIADINENHPPHTAGLRLGPLLRKEGKLKSPRGERKFVIACLASVRRVKWPSGTPLMVGLTLVLTP